MLHCYPNTASSNSDTSHAIFRSRHSPAVSIFGMAIYRTISWAIFSKKINRPFLFDVFHCMSDFCIFLGQRHGSTQCNLDDLMTSVLFQLLKTRVFFIISRLGDLCVLLASSVSLLFAVVLPVDLLHLILTLLFVIL